MPSFLYRLREYERTDNDDDGAGSKRAYSPQPVHLTQRVDGPQQPVAIAVPSALTSPQPQPLLFRCCYVICFLPCLLFSAARACYRFVTRSDCGSNLTALVLLASLLSVFITLFMIIALAQDRFARLHYTTPSLPAEATLGSFHYCYTPHPTTTTPNPATTCHTIDRHCTAAHYDLPALVGHRGESVSCERFDAFRALFLLAFIVSLFAPVTFVLYVLRPGGLHYGLAVGVDVVVVVCVVLEMVFFLPLLPPSLATSAMPATSTLSSSFWLQFSSMVFAAIVAAVTVYAEKKRRRNGWRRADSVPRSDRAEAESIMAAAARRQGKPVTEMTVATAGTAAAEQLEEGQVVSGVFALGSDVEHDLDLDSYTDSASSNRRGRTRQHETSDDVEREYAQAADEHDRESESGMAVEGRVEGKEEGKSQVEMHTVGLASAQAEQHSAEGEERRKTMSVSSRLP